MFGLKSEDIKLIKAVLMEYPTVEQALIFGSRALGNEKRGSDIDIALKGHLSEHTAAEIAGKLNDEVPLPYFFDVVHFETITNQELKDHIVQHGTVFYSKN